MDNCIHEREKDHKIGCMKYKTNVLSFPFECHGRVARMQITNAQMQIRLRQDWGKCLSTARTVVLEYIACLHKNKRTSINVALLKKLSGVFFLYAEIRNSFCDVCRSGVAWAMGSNKGDIWCGFFKIYCTYSTGLKHCRSKCQVHSAGNKNRNNLVFWIFLHFITGFHNRLWDSITSKGLSLSKTIG